MPVPVAPRAAAPPPPAPPAILSAQASDVTTDAATISWTLTGHHVASWVEYGHDHGDTLRSNRQPGAGAHELGLDHLDGSYWVRIAAQGDGGNTTSVVFGLATSEARPSPRGQTRAGPGPGNQTGSANQTAAPSDPGTYAIAGYDPAMRVTQTRRLTLVPVAPTTGAPPPASWSSQDPAILRSVDGQGNFLARSVGIAHVSASWNGGMATATVKVCANGRATVDQPDDQAGWQVHPVYLLPADGQDDLLDTDGQIAASVASWNGWFASQADNSHLRLDTCGGLLDTTFFRLAKTDDEYALMDVDRLGAFTTELTAAGLVAPQKVYALYYDGTTLAVNVPGGRGFASGLFGSLFLRCPSGCDVTQLGTTAPLGDVYDVVMMHEVLHAMGFVNRCSPHHSGPHVSDETSDIMFMWFPPAPRTLDANHDDYYKANVPDCNDLSRSPVLDPLPPPPWDDPLWTPPPP